VPAVVEELVEELGRSALAAELARNGRNGGLEHGRQPPACDGHLRDRLLALPLELGAKAGDVVEEPARLVFLGVEPGEVEEASPVMSRLHDLRVEVEPIAAVGRDQVDLVDVEAEVVQPAQALLQPETFGWSDDLGAGQLRPEPVVAEADLLRQLVGRKGEVELLAAELTAKVEELTGEVLLRDPSRSVTTPTGATAGTPRRGSSRSTRYSRSASRCGIFLTLRAGRDGLAPCSCTRRRKAAPRRTLD